MPAQFAEDGVRFSYPENWKLEREDTPDGWTITLQSPDTTFFMVSYDREMPEIEVVAETALEALRTEYPGLEADDAVETVAGQPAVGYDIRFFAFDLTNTGWARSFFGPNGTLLVLWQANDLELENTETILQAILRSLAVDED